MAIDIERGEAKVLHDVAGSQVTLLDLQELLSRCAISPFENPWPRLWMFLRSEAFDVLDTHLGASMVLEVEHE